jgi:hypothetical protein
LSLVFFNCAIGDAAMELPITQRREAFLWSQKSFPLYLPCKYRIFYDGITV